jgi:hypothetical protein
MNAADEFRAALTACNVREVDRLFRLIHPHLPPPSSLEATETAMHTTRSAADWLPDRARCYSHSWLVERDLPSQLPDHLKPMAERLYPRIAEGVFVSINTNSPLLKPAAAEVQKAVCDVVEDCYANGDTDPVLVRSRILDARASTFKRLLGTTRPGDVSHG